MSINARKVNSSPCHHNPTEIVLNICQGKTTGHSDASPAFNSLEHLVLQSGNMALQNMAYIFCRQLREEDLYISSNERKATADIAYHQYEKSVHALLTPHWSGSPRGLRKQVRRSLKPFRKSTGLLSRLLVTPARITATACLMVILGGQPADSSTLTGPATSSGQSMFPPAVKEQAQQREVVFADASLVNLELLLGDIPPQAQVILLKPSRNLIGQMLDHLLQNGPVERLHLFAHGAPGQLNFGDSVINQATLKHQAKQLNLLGALLNGSRDIYLYGCQVAAGRQGQDFVGLLASLTKADVAASDDFTGAADKGGDWQLELVMGDVDGQAITSVDYASILAIGTPGHIIAGDGSGGGGGGESGDSFYSIFFRGGAGGAGGESHDTLAGTAGDDVIFGDGSGGGGGGGDHYYGYQGQGGRGGGGSDTINGGGGNDILFGDGFNGGDGDLYGGEGGFGGGGGGGGSYDYSYGSYSGAKGEIGGGGGGGSDYAYGGAGGHGGGGGGGGSYSSGGSGGGFNATPGDSSFNNEGGGGGGGGYAGGLGGAGGAASNITPGNGGNGGNGTYTIGGGNGGSGGGLYGGGGGGGGFGGGKGGSGGDYLGAGGAGGRGGTTPMTLVDDSIQTVYSYVRGEVETPSAVPLTDRSGGAGHDILDGGPGSDYLFGMGGKNTFVFESDDTALGPDTDTIYDWNNGSGNKIRLQTGGISLDLATQIPAIIAAQTSTPTANDRTIVHQGSGNPVTIVVKGLGRDLTIDDFTTGVAYTPFSWGMFLPAIIVPK